MRGNFRWILPGALVLAFVIGGLSRISFNVEILKLLPTHLPQVQGLSLLLKYFALPDELIITLDARDGETAEAAADSLAAALAAHPDLVKQTAARPPWEENPVQLGELLAFQLLNLPPHDFAAALARLDPAHAPATLRDALDELSTSLAPETVALRSYDPFGLTTSLPLSAMAQGNDEFASADGTFRVIYVESAAHLGNYVDAIRWVRTVKQLAADWNRTHHVTLGFTGQPSFVADISGNMQGEMTLTGGSTLLLIATIFWLCYRRIRPLVTLLAMLALTFLLALAAAGWFLDQLTVIGVGFASVMIGLSVDYGYFVFHQATRHPGSLGDLRRKCFLNIAWTCSTTAAAFFALNLSSLPGLSQLGNLVGIGVLVGAAVMLGIFAPLAMRNQRVAPIATPVPAERLVTSPRFFRAGAWLVLALVAVLLGALVIKGPPAIDFSANTMRPRVSDAYVAMDKLYARLSDDRGLLSLVVTGSTPDEVSARLREAGRQLSAAVQRGDTASFQTALPLWPDAARQRENLARTAPLAGDLPRLRQTLLDAGFTEPAFALTESVVRQWTAWSAKSPPIWPSNAVSSWILRRFVKHDGGQFLASGIVYPVRGRENALLDTIGAEGIYLVSWEQLGRELKRVVPGEMLRVMAALFAGVVGILAFGLRSIRAVLLFIATTALVLACLAGAITLLGGTIGLFGLAAVLLLLGTGTDYSILLLLALRRNGGDVSAAQRDLALVILLCCASAVAGFGSISWANNLGLAELGRTCAIGLAIDACISLFLLPPAWALLQRWLPKKATQ
ncbi:MAG: MMPL family transporter [Terrimicrobiaceae bacterium]|nr:MMPL family transporter [Terrimicrobiaceae bacterium]